MNLKLRSILLLTAIFLAGVASGGFLAFGPLHHWGMPSRPPFESFASRHVKQLTKALGLTEDQHAQVEKLVKETESRLEKTRHEAREQTTAVFRELNGRIKALLTPEQLPKFEDFQKEQAERMKEMERQRHAQMDRGDKHGPPQPGPPGPGPQPPPLDGPLGPPSGGPPPPPPAGQ